MPIYIIDEQSKWFHLLNQENYQYLTLRKGITTHEQLVFELMKIADQGITYIGELPLEIKTLASIHSFELTPVVFDSKYQDVVLSFISYYNSVFTIQQFEEWFSHLEWKFIFNSLVANNAIFACKSGFRRNPLIHSSSLVEENFSTLGPLCRSYFSRMAPDPLLQGVRMADGSDSDEWMSE